MKVYWQKRVEIPRSRDLLLLHREGYWSANQVIFSAQMPQDCQETYTGQISIVDFPIRKCIINLRNAGSIIKERGVNIPLAGAIEALWVGTHYPGAIREFGGFLAPSSLVSPDNEDWFCPFVFRFGRQISAGLELLDKEKGDLFVKAKTKLLVLGEISAIF